MSQPADDMSRPSEHEGSNVELETLVSELSARFLNLPPGKVDREIEDVQRRVCEAVGIDSSVLWQASTAFPEAFTPTHYYMRAGAQPPEPMRQEHFPYVSKQILTGHMVRITSLDELPSEAAVDRQHAELFGIRSNLSLPISSGGALPVACLSFNAMKAERDWPDALVNRLQLVAHIFGDALARQRGDNALQESETWLSLALDSAEAGVAAVDFRTGIIRASQRSRAIFGFSRDEVVTMERVEARVHPEDLSLYRDTIARGIRSGMTESVVYRLLTDEGGVRWISDRGRIHFAPTGEPEGIIGVSVDVTDQKRSEEALVASKARLQAGAELAGLAFYEEDSSTGTVFADDRYRDLCGVPPGLEQGLQMLEFWLEHLHPDDAADVVDVRQQTFDGRLDQFILEYRFLPPGQVQKWIHHITRVAERDAAGHVARSYGVLRDVTEQRRAEEELRDLSRRLMQAQEEERAFLARELHDDVSQQLAVLAIDVGRTELSALEGEQAKTMRAVREGLIRLSEDVHSLAYQLHPSVLKDLGLADALRTEGERCRRQSLHVWVHLDPLPAHLAEDVALCLFRVAHEALNNVIRHAGSHMATLRLRPMDGGFLLAISDNGVGFDPADPGRSGSLGLVSMRERLRLVNGTFDIESAPGHGTTVIAWVPAEGGS